MSSRPRREGQPRDPDEGARRVLLTTLTENGHLARDETGLVCIASVLRARGHRVLFLDCEDGEIKNEREVLEFDPDVFGIGMYTITRRASIELCRRIRDTIPGIVVCAGGYLPTYYGTELLEEADCIDFAVRGEGELILLDALSNLGDLEAVDGITYRKGGEVVANPAGEIVRDLNALPFPIDETMYADPGLDIVYVSSSRGCLSNCSFCLASSFNRKWRGIDPEKVVDGISEIYRRYDKRNFGFTDATFEDSLTRRPGSAGGHGGSASLESRMRIIAAAFIERGLKLCYYVNVTASFYRTASDELMRLLLESGLTNVYIGLESGNELDLDLYAKRADLRDNAASIRFFRRWGIHPTLGFIGFNPYSTFDRLRANLDFLEEFGLCYHFYFVNRLILYRGARILRQVEKDGLLIEDGDYCDHRYRLADPKLGVLSEFLAAYFAPYRRTRLFSYALPHLFGVYRSKMSYFERELEVPSEELISSLRAMADALDETMVDFSNRNGILFRRLLDLCEDGWDESEALRLTRQGFDSDYMVDRIEEVLKLKSRVDRLLVGAGFHENMI